MHYLRKQHQQEMILLDLTVGIGTAARQRKQIFTCGNGLLSMQIGWHLSMYQQHIRWFSAQNLMLCPWGLLGQSRTLGPIYKGPTTTLTDCFALVTEMRGTRKTLNYYK